MLKSLHPREVKVTITVDDVRLRSNFTTTKTITFTNKSFFYVVLGFIQSRLSDFCDKPVFLINTRIVKKQ